MHIEPIVIVIHELMNNNNIFNRILTVILQGHFFFAKFQFEMIFKFLLPSTYYEKHMYRRTTFHRSLYTNQHRLDKFFSCFVQKLS